MSHSRHRRLQPPADNEHPKKKHWVARHKIRAAIAAVGLVLVAAAVGLAVDAVSSHDSSTSPGDTSHDSTLLGNGGSTIGMHKIGALWMSCAVTLNSYNEATGISIKIYNPSPSPVPLNDIGVAIGDNGILVTQQTLTNGDGPVPADSTVTLQSPFDGAIAANSCDIAGWGPGSPGSSAAVPAATPTTATPTYTYQDGWQAATKATYIDLNVAASNDQNGGDTFTPQQNDNYWCIDNDPNTDDTGGNNSSGSYTGDSSAWYQGCMAELTANPPKPLAITPSTPGYSEGYAVGKQNASQANGYGGAQAWCDVYADPDYTYAPGNGQDQNPNDDPAIVGCIAALHAQGIQ